MKDKVQDEAILDDGAPSTAAAKTMCSPDSRLSKNVVLKRNDKTSQPEAGDVFPSPTEGKV